jgi:hypothetical protein
MLGIPPKQPPHSLRMLTALAGLLLPLGSLDAATWTNFLGDLQWRTAVNWSPNTVPNGDGVVADFQVDVPGDATILVGGTGVLAHPDVGTLMLGDTNGTAGITLLKTGTTSRLDFTNSVGTALIEKRGEGNDSIEVGRMNVYTGSLPALLLSSSPSADRERSFSPMPICTPPVPSSARRPSSSAMTIASAVFRAASPSATTPPCGPAAT